MYANRGRYIDAVAPAVTAPQRQCLPRTNVKRHKLLLAAGELNVRCVANSGDTVQPLWEVTVLRRSSDQLLLFWRQRRYGTIILKQILEKWGAS